MGITRRSSQSLAEVEAGLRSLHDHCLSGLVCGLQAMEDGDLTVAVVPRTQPLDAAAARGAERELIELFNAMLQKARQALETTRRCARGSVRPWATTRAWTSWRTA